MKHCKDCLFYDARRSFCEKVDRDNIKDSMKDDFRIRLSVSDDTDLSVNLQVGPLFGCVQWKAKNENWITEEHFSGKVATHYLDEFEKRGRK